VTTLWRLSLRRDADRLDGGYGLRHAGRWNSVGRAVTYAASSPSLCALERLVQIGSADLLPEGLMMIRYEVPSIAPTLSVAIADLAADWRKNVTMTRRRGDRLLAPDGPTVILVPSAVMGFADCPDMNAIINHHHPAAGTIRIAEKIAFSFDQRRLR